MLLKEETQVDTRFDKALEFKTQVFDDDNEDST